MKQTVQPDFTGQNIYVGMDVHKKSWTVSIFSEHHEHKTFTQPPNAQSLVGYLKRTFPGATYHAVYEAGFCGYWIYDSLHQQGVDSMVVNPADVPTTDKQRRGKNDKIDSRKLGKNLRSHDLQPIYIPCTMQREDRSLVRTRHGMVCKQTRCKNQITSLLAFYGVFLPPEMETKRWSRRFINWLESIQLEHTSGTIALKTLIEELLHLRKLIAGLTRQIVLLSRTYDYAEAVWLLRTIPGISTLTAMILLTEIGDISRFKNLDTLASYAGLIPDTKSSGEEEHITNITMRRNPMLRAILVESSWVAVRKDPALMLAFNKLCRRLKKTNAIIHIARKLLNRIRFVLKNRQPYVLAIVA
ncbi:MAG: IS110 family transposase [Planctomycetaceae bacterium]|nr:MAG: IS110 family transposase [Planctomycetaceae bacterium]